MKRISPEEFGKPSIDISCLQLWVLGRQFEDLQDYWDGNWLRVIVHCASEASDVWAEGPILHLSELEYWLIALRGIAIKQPGTAELSCIEPNLWAKIDIDKIGRGQLNVRLTEEHTTENHEFITSIDQSYLPNLISSLEIILAEYPIRGEQPKK